MVNFPKQAAELHRLITKDQAAWRSFWQQYYDTRDTPEFVEEFAKVRQLQKQRSEKVMQILEEIQEPALSNVGAEAAQALSVVALHDSLSVLRKVLAAFQLCYERDKSDTYVQAIPSMVDRVAILERRPQTFGTLWELDENGQPFLPTVEDFAHVNEHRAEYGIEPLRWPKSLAIPEEKQPWLKCPISDAVMRDLTDEEYEKLAADYLD